jgi:hypothetical protein
LKLEGGKAHSSHRSIKSAGYWSRPVPWQARNEGPSLSRLSRSCSGREALQHQRPPPGPATRTRVPVQPFGEFRNPERVVQVPALIATPFGHHTGPPHSLRYLSSLVSLRTTCWSLVYCSCPIDPTEQHQRTLDCTTSALPVTVALDLGNVTRCSIGPPPPTTTPNSRGW